jgi:hypothetical protein
MSQLPLFLAIHLVGLAVVLAVGPRQRTALAAALAFPLGLVVVVGLALLVLIAGLPYRGGVVVATAATAIAAAVVAARRGLGRRELAIAGAWTAGFTAATALLCVRNYVLMSNDSYSLVMLAIGVANDGALPPETILMIDEWGVFQIVAQSLLVFTRQDFLYSLPLVLGLSFVPVFALTLAAAPPRRGVVVVALVTVALFTINMVEYHVVYLHTNWGSAIYLFGFVVLYWFAEVEGEPAYAAPAFLSLTGFALQRAENPLVALLFVALTLGPSALPRRPIAPWFGLFVATIVLWYEVIARHVSPDGAFLTPMRCHVVAGSAVVAYAWWLASTSDRMRAINRRLPLVVAAVIALAVAATFALRPDHMTSNVEVWIENLRTGEHWGYAWYVIAGLIAVTLWFQPPPFRSAFVIGIPAFFGIGLALGYLGPGYRVGTGDSANRMTIHIVPLLFWYLALKLPVTASSDRARASRSA